MDDLVVSVRQIGQYPITTGVGPGDLLIMQQGGLGGPYVAISPTDLIVSYTGPLQLSSFGTSGDVNVGGALGIGGHITGEGNLDVLGYVHAGGNLVIEQGAEIGGTANAGGFTVSGVPVATQDFVNAIPMVNTFNGRVGQVSLLLQDIIIGGGAPIDSPMLQGCPTAPTPELESYSSRLATTKFVRDAFDQFWHCYFTADVIQTVIIDPIQAWALATFQSIPQQSATAPTSPINGNLWWNPTTGHLSIWVQPDPTVAGAWQVIGGGSQGPQGIPGPVGPVGPQGPQGSQGLTGSQGPQGVTGPAGPPGTTAFSNLNYRGTWIAGTYYKNDYVVAPDNHGYVCIATSTTETPSSTATDWSFFVAQGAPGPQGPSGSAGPAGPPGVTGAEGPPGPAGPDGQQGIQGPAGNPGAAGPAGPTGPVGQTGPQGPQGAVGPQGLTGPQGSQGPAGAGIIPGGTVGQVLSKLSNTDYDVAWQTKGGLPTGGTLGQVLTKNSATDFDAVWSQPAMQVPNCGRLLFVSATALSYLPFNGGVIKINGILYPLPTGANGIAGLNNTNVYREGLAGQNLAASTQYFVYVFNNGGVLTADYSILAPVVSTTTGNVGTMVKGGTTPPDDTRSLIGMVYMGGSALFVDTNASRFVRSWFNRLPVRAMSSSSNVAFGGSSTWVNVTGFASFLCWADDAISITANISAYTSGAANATVYGIINLDATNVGVGNQATSPSVINAWMNVANTYYNNGQNINQGLHNVYGAEMSQTYSVVGSGSIECLIG